MVASSGEVLVHAGTVPGAIATLRCADARASQEARICTEVTGGPTSCVHTFRRSRQLRLSCPTNGGSAGIIGPKNSHRADPASPAALELRECSRIPPLLPRRCNSDPGRRLKSHPASRLVLWHLEGQGGWGRRRQLEDPGNASAWQGDTIAPRDGELGGTRSGAICVTNGGRHGGSQISASHWSPPGAPRPRVIMLRPPLEPNPGSRVAPRKNIGAGIGPDFGPAADGLYCKRGRLHCTTPSPDAMHDHRQVRYAPAAATRPSWRTLPISPNLRNAKDSASQNPQIRVLFHGGRRRRGGSRSRPVV